MLAAYLERELKAIGLPIVGVVVGDTTNRATWTPQFASDPTNEQRIQARVLLDTIVADTTVLADMELGTRFAADKLQRAVVIWAAGKFGLTPQEARAEIIAVYRSL